MAIALVCGAIMLSSKAFVKQMVASSSISTVEDAEDDENTLTTDNSNIEETEDTALSAETPVND